MFTAAGPLVAGIIASSVFGDDLGMAITCIVAVSMLGALVLFIAPETKGKLMPTDESIPLPTNDKVSSQGESL